VRLHRTVSSEHDSSAVEELNVYGDFVDSVDSETGTVKLSYVRSGRAMLSSYHDNVGKASGRLTTTWTDRT